MRVRTSSGIDRRNESADNLFSERQVATLLDCAGWREGNLGNTRAICRSRQPHHLREVTHFGERMSAGKITRTGKQPCHRRLALTTLGLYCPPTRLLSFRSTGIAQPRRDRVAVYRPLLSDHYSSRNISAEIAGCRAKARIGAVVPPLRTKRSPTFRGRQFVPWSSRRGKALPSLDRQAQCE